MLKYEYTLLSSTVRGLAWSPDSKRLAVCGGEQSKGGEAVCVAFDTGARLGEIAGHSKCITCIAYRPRAPFRLMTGGEDSHVIFHEGPPFKFLKSQQNVHSSFVNAVAFTPDGASAFSCASDGLVAMYNGDTGDLLSVLSPKLSCSIWGLAPLGLTSLVIACGDKKLRTIVDMQIANEVVIGNGSLTDMPLGVSSSLDKIVSTSLDGSLRTWSHELTLVHTWCGSQAAITAIVRSSTGAYHICSAEGAVWTLFGDTAKTVLLPKPIKGNCGLLMDENNYLWGVSAKTDSELLCIDTDTKITSSHSFTMLVSGKFAFADKSTCVVSVNNGSVSRIAALVPGVISAFAVSSQNHMAVVYEKERQNNLQLQSEKRVVHVFREKLLVVETEITSSDIVCLAIEADLLAVASANHELHVYKLEAGTYAPIKLTIRCWTYHKARIACMRWVRGRYLVSAGLDKQVIVWDVENPSDGPVAQLRDLHREGISAMCVYEEGNVLSIVTGGVEGSVRFSSIDLNV